MFWSGGALLFQGHYMTDGTAKSALKQKISEENFISFCDLKQKHSWIMWLDDDTNGL